jgi:hypothetical protein
MWGRHGKHRADRNEKRLATDAAAPGFGGLEGDFEEERRRAAAASHERVERYGEDDDPPFPDTKAGLFHP